jgi:tetratricopeptide (TPR) repeat protein
VAICPGVGANHCNLGECLRETGRLDEAVVQIRIGLAIDPDQPDAHNSLGLIHHAQHRLELAEESLRAALLLRPRFPMAMINLGMVLQEQRRLKEAAESFRSALEIEPANPMGCSNLGQILVELGRIEDLDESERLCSMAIRLTPGQPHPINNLGNVYRAMNRYEEALECYQRATAIAPGMAMPLNNIAQALQGRAYYTEAKEYYLRALAIEPSSARIHANYASMFMDQEDFDAALERYRHALAIDPTHAESLCGIGQVCMKSEDLALAEKSFCKALEIDPELTAPRIGLSNLYAELGDFDRADAEAAIALERQPKLVEPYYEKSQFRKGNVSDHELEMMTTVLDEKYLGDGGRALINFAIGTVLDNRRNHAAAAQHFRVANQHQLAARSKRRETYDAPAFANWTGRIVTGFSAELMERTRNSGHASTVPIFVVGLPRSGTTLTEQILASHSAIHGRGELKTVSEAFEKLPKISGLAGSDSFEALKSLNSVSLRACAEYYLQEARKPAINTPFIVDKMPDNMMNLGWIRLMFPNAKVIYCRRDYRDIALSCWQTCFGAIRWANRWHEIAQRFTASLRVLDHWKTIPQITWLDFQYESVVDDTETYARRLIEYVGLDWEPNCLDFHKTTRPVRTASQSQVRQPIYKTSVAKWKNYAHEMTDFTTEMKRLGYRFDD